MKKPAAPAPADTDPIPAILRQARWIWPESQHWDLHNGYAQFRKKFTLERVPRRAPLYITADQSYQLCINAQFVCRGPARGHQAHWPFDEVDVARFLKPGVNVIAVRAHNPGFSNFQYVSHGYAGLLLGAQWGSVRIVTDKTWAMRRQRSVKKDTVPTSVQLFCQEHFDARLDWENWMDADFDESLWKVALPGFEQPGGSAWNSMPWASLEPRNIPLLREGTALPVAILGEATGECGQGETMQNGEPENYKNTRDVARVRVREGLAHSAWKGAAPVISGEGFSWDVTSFGEGRGTPCGGQANALNAAPEGRGQSCLRDSEPTGRQDCPPPTDAASPSAKTEELLTDGGAGHGVASAGNGFGPGKFRSYLLDFGRTVVGNLSLTLDGCAGGEMADVFVGEALKAGLPEGTLEPVAVYPSHSRLAIGCRLVARQGTTRHTFFHPMGFRYLVLTLRDFSPSPTRPVRVTLKLNTIGYPLERKGRFASSEPGLNAIWEACAWTQQCCSLDAYVDTPWREQAQWWGDARVQGMNTFFLSGDARLLRRGIASIAGQTTPGGLTYGHAPTIAHDCILPDFTLIWALTLWDHYWQTGSPEAFLAHQKTLRGVLDYFAGQTDAQTGLVRFDPRYWLFLDWTELHREGYPTMLNMWLLEALEKTARLYRVARKPEGAKPLEAWSHRLRGALAALVNKEGLLQDGRTLAGRVVPETSVHSQTMALMTRLAPQHENAMLQRVLLPFIRGESEPKAFPSSYWVNYVLGVLTERGHGAEVVDFIRKKWAPMAAYGGTWECYDTTSGDGCASHSHAWSAHPLYHLMQTLGGIRQTAPGWAAIRFAPVFEGDSNECAVPTLHGLIQSRWKRQPGQRGKGGDIIEVSLLLPKNVTATVELPGLKLQKATGRQRWTIAAPHGKAP